MKTISRCIRWIPAFRRIEEYMSTEMTEVRHTTLNPMGPGVIRIHLIPPEKNSCFSPSVAIVNGTDIVPVNYLWALTLCELIRQTNVYDGKEIDEGCIQEILRQTVGNVKQIVGILRSRKKIEEDIQTLYETFRQIAYREPVTADIKYLSIGEYADVMRAPHRMDLMVSAMVKDGRWHCNQKCIHCYAAGQIHAEERELSTEEWKKIIDSCRAAGIPQLTFTGGEPTMRDDLFELIRYARWFISRLNTNGIRLTPEYCRKLKEAELDSVQITFYSSDPEVHNRLVGAEQFEHTAAAIVNAVQEGLCVSINTPLCRLNRDYVRTLAYLHERGVIFVTCSGLITTGNALNEESMNLQLSTDEIKSVLADAVQYCHENGMEIAFTSPGWVEEEFCEELGITVPSCGACLSNMAITPSGNAVPCQSWLSEAPLGNMLTGSWESIWDDDRAVSFRNNSAALGGKCPLRRWC